MQEMEYEFLSGKKIYSKLIYLKSDKQLFKLKSKNPTKCYYMCYYDGCKSRVELLLNKNSICVKPKKFKEHNHETQEEMYEELKAMEHIKKECIDSVSIVSELTPYKCIQSAYKRVNESNQQALSNICFAKIQRGLQYLTQRVIVNFPATAVGIVEAFNRENIWKEYGITKHADTPCHFFKACIQESEFSYCIFYSEHIGNLIKQNISPRQRNYLIDDSIEIVPQGCFKHLLIIHVDYFEEQIFPFIFVLMDRRTRQAYEHLFKYINENIYSMEPNSFITDYETSMQNSLKAVFPNAECYGCWFHYCQSIGRNVATNHKNLSAYIQRDEKASHLFYKILALPLLPAKSIPVTFYFLKNEIKTYDKFKNFSRFLIDFKKQWIEKIGPKNLSVFKLRTRITSAIETYNGGLSRMLPKKEQFFKFVSVLCYEEFNQSKNFKLLIESSETCCHKKRKMSNDDDKATQILEASDLLQKGTLTPITFLNRIVRIRMGNETETTMNTDTEADTLSEEEEVETIGRVPISLHSDMISNHFDLNINMC